MSARRKVRRVELGLAGAVTTDRVDVHSRDDHVVREDRRVRLVGGARRDDVGPSDGVVPHLWRARRRSQGGSILRINLSSAAGSVSHTRKVEMPMIARNASAWNSACVPVPIIAMTLRHPVGRERARQEPTSPPCATPSGASFRPRRSGSRCSRWPIRRTPSRSEIRCEDSMDARSHT